MFMNVDKDLCRKPSNPVLFIISTKIRKQPSNNRENVKLWYDSGNVDYYAEK